MKDMMLEPNLKKCATRMIREEFAARKIAITQLIFFGRRVRGDA